MEDLVPTEFYLSRNFPDPFKEKTTIKYCLPESIQVTIVILDYEKRKVKTLVDEIKEAGTHQVEFYANGFREGIYFYSLITSNFVVTKKMLLLE